MELDTIQGKIVRTQTPMTMDNVTDSFLSFWIEPWCCEWRLFWTFTMIMIYETEITIRTNVFSRVKECTLLQCLHTDVLVFVAWVILTVCVIICYQVYKVFLADSRSLDGISRYRSVNFLVFVIFFVIILDFSERLLPDCTVLTLLFTSSLAVFCSMFIHVFCPCSSYQ